MALSTKTCMNALCGSASSSSTAIEWKKGWALRSGEFAWLCYKCGTAYEQSLFCELFHSEESGWRDCSSCAKRLHCGCIASRFLLELLDGGGVNCIGCVKSSGLTPMVGDEKANGFSTMQADNVSADNHLSCGFVDKLKLMQTGNAAEGHGLRNLLQFQGDERNGVLGHMKQEEVLPHSREFGSTSFSNFYQGSNGSSQAAKLANTGARDMYEQLTQTNLSITLGAPSGNPNAFHGASGEERGYNHTSSMFQPGPRSRHLLPKPPKPAVATGLETNTGLVPQIRVARPPTEGRGRNQLLPRYWPRITDQELQQISGDPNSTVVPLFEKVLSASDAGRIGRLVLPKACAEAYFPPISQAEGLPIRIQDIKGKEWVFQFRFWPNNNSRMYVLEGVTPCIQSMQLQAGDTVTFSRRDPEGKLVMGFRKASNSIGMQDTQPSTIANGAHSSESFFSGVFENLPVMRSYSGLLQSLKGNNDSHLSALSRHLNSTSADLSWHKSEKQELLSSMLIPEKKRARNIGTKSKRLLMDSLDVLELRLTWEEAQDLLRPPPSVMPSIVTIEELDIEEYEEPPVFGKRSIYLIRAAGRQEQWVQCDSCSKWRRLPTDVLLPANWTCGDNTWDQSRSSCAAPDELSPRELEHLHGLNNDFKRQRLAASHRPNPEYESSGLDTLANAAVLEDNGADPGTVSVAATTKHPRHRPGCSCIVCIQPPSGKGKHMPTCTCNVCMTVKRRFKTLAMRKKKRQSEREAEIAMRNQHLWGANKEEAEVDSTSKRISLQHDPSENETRSMNELESRSQSKNSPNKLVEPSKGHLDLNCQPDREEDMQTGSAHMSMVSLLQVANLPLDTYLKQNGLSSLTLTPEQQESSTSPVLAANSNKDNDGLNDKDQCSASAAQENGGEDNCDAMQDETQNEPQ